jgi:hypothetical protein
MNRPTEQLIRDYLNRLSLAAKTRLEPGDRQALLDHTRARIDAGCGGAAHPTADQVRRTLAGLGDPIALVENERSRIAARKAWDEDGTTTRQDAGSRHRGDAAAASRSNRSGRQVWPPPATPVIARQPFLPPVIIPPATANAQVPSARAATTTSSPAPPPAFLVSPAVLPGQPGEPVVASGAVQRAEAISVRNAAWAGPPVSPSEVPQNPTSANGSAQAANPSSEEPSDRPGPARPTSPTAPRGLPPLRGVPAPRGVPAANEPPASSGEPAPPGGAGRGAGGSAGSNGLSSRPPAQRPAPESTGSGPRSSPRAAGAAAGPGKPEPEAEAEAEPRAASDADEDQPAIEFSIDPADVEVLPSRLAVVGDAAVRQLKRLGSVLLTIALRDRLETASLLLLGIGGAIYPPVWLIGAVIAVSSRKWDLRDKWLGLVLPVVAVVIGAALEVTFGAHFTAYHLYLVEAWVAASRLSRVAAILCALYLLWRLHKHGGSRTRRLPPWISQV